MGPLYPPLTLRFHETFWFTFVSPHRYACTRSGHVLEIHYSSVSLKRAWHLLPGNQGGGVAITVLYLHEAFSVTGSEDGVLRIWPNDFSSPFLEAGTLHDTSNIHTF